MTKATQRKRSVESWVLRSLSFIKLSHISEPMASHTTPSRVNLDDPNYFQWLMSIWCPHLSIAGTPFTLTKFRTNFIKNVVFLYRFQHYAEPFVVWTSHARLYQLAPSSEMTSYAQLS